MATNSANQTLNGYQPIENYGLIGDMRSVALVGLDGSIDWFCFPYFDSPSVFAKILDQKKGGAFRIAPIGNHLNCKQFYWPDTNVLVTRFFTKNGVGEITDFMPIDEGQDNFQRRIIRQVKTVRGRLAYRLECKPAFDYARSPHTVHLETNGACFHGGASSIGLTSPATLDAIEHGVRAEFSLKEGETKTFTLMGLPSEGACLTGPDEHEADALFRKTVTYWRRWISQCTYRGRWREMVQRSAFVLKLLTFEPTGAIVAAATTSLPEGIGGERNWDYRYTWIRDAAFTVYAFLRIGFTEEAAHFMNWIENRCNELNPDSPLQIMYGINGRHDLTEQTLDHLDGYRSSKPVRIGNGAYDQIQLDIYGELLDAVYLFNKYGSPISYDLWEHLCRLVDWVCDNWKQKDEGVWEVRDGKQHFVYSKMMCWVALDRAIRLADKRSFPADRQKWLAVRDEIYREIIKKGWSDERQAFVQYYGSDTLDAANLMMPLTLFVSPTDPRILKTLDQTLKSPEQGGLVANSLVYRYNLNEATDGLDGEEGTFNICTFWLVEALTRAGKRSPHYLDQARLIFEKMLGFANHLGLYAEEIGPHGEALGNYPQAFTHLALISAAYNLDRSLGDR